MKFRVNDIKNFVATSSCRTLMQASQKLEISQPALSESLKRLESDAKTILFYRSRQGIKLTPSGREFLQKCVLLMNAYNELGQMYDANQIFASRSITIGSHPTVAQYCLPKALALIKKQAPDFKVELKHDLSRNIQSEIQNGNIDIGIIINAIKVPDLIVNNLGFDVVAIWSKNNNQVDTIICNQNLFQTQSILKKWKHSASKIIHTDSLELICRFVNEGIGHGIIPSRAVQLSGYHFYQNKHFPIYKDQIYLVYRPEFGKTLSEKIVIESLKKSILVE